jgi:curved DNA-binding protein CbpA
MAQRVINRYSNLSIDEVDSTPTNMKRKAEKKLREIENLKQRSTLTPEELNKLAREQEWLDILNPPPPTQTFSNEPVKQTNKQRKKEKEREAKKKRAEELRKQQEAREEKEREAREKYQREYQARQEEFRRARREQEERQRTEEEATRKRNAALGNKYMNDPLAIELYTTYNDPLAIHLYTEYGDVKTQKENRIAFHRLSLKYHPDKTGGTTTEHQKIIGFIRDYLQEALL